MAESKVQLKREEVVGDEVVLEDIDPKTSTGSVVDEASGLNLNEVIARLKDDINSQLSRVVNSVNGRTGVVVLTAKDVGLGNVDNVSLADIQKWTLDELEHAFLTRGFKIFETLNEVDTILNDQDHTLNGSGFFTKTGHIDDNDKKSYIGYFALDENDILVAQAVSINNIGVTDNSLLYDEKAGDKDYTGGKLGINIWKDEEGLEIYNGISETDDPKENAGLRINREKVLPTTFYFEGCYGSNWDEPGEAEDSWLYLGMADIPEDAPEVIIYYDNEKLTTTTQKFYSKERNIRKHDIIICSFSSKYIKLKNDGKRPNRPVLYPIGLCERLVNRHMARGVVTSVELDENKKVIRYTVEFHSFKPNVMGGLVYTSQYSINPDYTVSDPTGEETDVGGSTMNFGPYQNDALMVRLSSGAVDTFYTTESIGNTTDKPLIIDDRFIDDDISSFVGSEQLLTENLETAGEYKSLVFNANVSGLNVRENPIRSSVSNDIIDSVTPDPLSGYPNPINNDWRYTNLPIGPFPSFDPRFNSKVVNYGGLGILPDASLCVIPADAYMSFIGQGSMHVSNWRADADFYIPELANAIENDRDGTSALDPVSSNAAFGGECLLGINLNKAISSDTDNRWRTTHTSQTAKLANLSGLKIFHAGPIPPELNNPDEDIKPTVNGHQITGGLAINCGTGLKIEPPVFFENYQQFYDGGKLCIDFDAFDSGLEEDEEGKLTVSVGYGKGVMKYADNTIGINLKKSAIGFNSAGAPDINVLKQWTGLSSKFLILDPESLASFKANGSYYESVGGKLCAKTLVINTGDGIKIDTKNAIAVRVATKTRKLVDGVPQKDSNGKFIYTPHGHGLCIYEDPSVNDTKDQMTDESYTGGAIGVQVVDPGTNTGHGITINEHGTLCVDFSANTETGDNSGIIEDIKKNLKLDEWTITGNEIVTVNNIPQTDPTKVTYTYNPTNQPLNIKLGKGLIFIDERGLNDNDDDDDGCGCPNCKCNYCDYVVNMPGKETFHVLEWIRSDGLQRVDLDMQFSSDNTHIFEPVYLHTVGTDEDKRDYSNGTQIIFAAGRLNAIGTQTLICDKGTTYAEIIDKNEDVVKTEKNIKRDPGKKFTGSITYKVTKISANWKYGDDTSDPVVETDNISEEVACDSDGLAVSLVSIFGVPHKLGGNLSTNAKITMYGFKIYEKTKLKCIADLIPVKCVCDNGTGPRHGLVGLFDRISKTFYPNSAKETGITPNFIAGPETDVILNSKGEDISGLSGEKAVTYIGLRHITSETMSNRIIINDAPLNPEAKKRIIQVEFVNIHGGSTIKRQDIITIGDGEKGTQRFFLGGPGGISKSASVVNNDGTEAIAEQNESSAIGTDMRTFIGYVTFSADNKLITGDLIHISDEAAQEIVRSQSSAGFDTDKLAAGPITLFSGYTNSNIISDPALIRLYSIKILEDDKITPIVDLKPVIRSDNVVGLLDIVNKKFYQDKDDTLFTASRETTGVIYNWQGEEIKDI